MHRRTFGRALLGGAAALTAASSRPAMETSRGMSGGGQVM